MSDRLAKPRVRIRADGTMEAIDPAIVAAPGALTKKPVPWKGRRRAPDPKEARVTIRLTGAEYATVFAAAAQAGLSAAAYVRVQTLGSAGPRAVRRPAVDRVTLARVLGLLGNYTGNLNQLSRVANTSGELPTADDLAELARQVTELRSGVMQALGREP